MTVPHQLRLLLPFLALSILALGGCQKKSEEKAAGETEQTQKTEPPRGIFADLENGSVPSAVRPDQETEEGSNDASPLTARTEDEIHALEIRMEEAELREQGMLPDSGAVQGNRYVNEFFEMVWEIPDRWLIASARAFDELEAKGAELDEIDDPENSAPQRQWRYPLLLVSKDKINESASDNSALILVAERLGPGTTEVAYLETIDNALRGSMLSYERLGQIEKKYRFGARFALAAYQLNAGENELYQAYLVTVQKGYALTFVATSSEKAIVTALGQLAMEAKFGDGYTAQAAAENERERAESGDRFDDLTASAERRQAQTEQADIESALSQGLPRALANATAGLSQDSAIPAPILPQADTGGEKEISSAAEATDILVDEPLPLSDEEISDGVISEADEDEIIEPSLPQSGGTSPVAAEVSSSSAIIEEEHEVKVGISEEMTEMRIDDPAAAAVRSIEEAAAAGYLDDFEEDMGDPVSPSTSEITAEARPLTDAERAEEKADTSNIRGGRADDYAVDPEASSF